ncbi:uncharacterized protein B0P05DRAFT_564019 [Gilbertella persicaria]|uniref:uncharacterized protein n=1 Tax=Gilbertella persicaria TaxID=101096 RepID=UPI0022210128|nr:uncharacterized protein B0P05DRAFT_564019 [Gilbertella persicaria]KAI8048924.1 hypothetical protein B0P05DRAFT_564019 [Gilbertella persicaria]
MSCHTHTHTHTHTSENELNHDASNSFYLFHFPFSILSLLCTMGQAKSKESDILSKRTHFTTKEIEDLRQNVKEKDHNHITEEVFKDSVKNYVPTISLTDDAFLKRLYCAFGGTEEQSIDFSKFVDGLSVFMKGTNEEKLQLSFKLYDIDRDGYISKDEIENVIFELSRMLSEDDKESEELQTSINCMFEDFDVDCDGKLSFEEYKLSTIKEPLIADFFERFLVIHNLSSNPSPVSRPVSLRSKQSFWSLNNCSQNHFRLSQAELLDYSHQQQQQQIMTSSDDTPHTLGKKPSTHQLISSNSSQHQQPASSLQQRLSRGPSMVSLDAALTTM